MKDDLKINGRSRRWEAVFNRSAVRIMIASSSMTQGPEIRKRGSAPQVTGPTDTQCWAAMVLLSIPIGDPHHAACGIARSIVIQKVDMGTYRHYEDRRSINQMSIPQKPFTHNKDPSPTAILCEPSEGRQYGPLGHYLQKAKVF
jgi:hypothetical protein